MDEPSGDSRRAGLPRTSGLQNGSREGTEMDSRTKAQRNKAWSRTTQRHARRSTSQQDTARRTWHLAEMWLQRWAVTAIAPIIQGQVKGYPKHAAVDHERNQRTGVHPIEQDSDDI